MLNRIERKEGLNFKGLAHSSFGLRQVKFADDGAPGSFSGYGAVFNNVDGGGDLIMPGAFTDTLAAWKAKGKLPKMLWQHGGWMSGDDILPIGKWTSMVEDGKGLAVEGRLFALDTDRGRTIYAGLKEEEMNSLSIGYVATDYVYGSKAEEPYRTIKKAELYEVSPVLFGMNDLATIDDAKAANKIRSVRDFESFLRDAGFSKAASISIASSGFKANPTLRDEGGVADALADLRKRAAGIFTPQA